MKRTISLLLLAMSVMFGITAYASPITSQQAQQNAFEFLKKKGKTIDKSVMRDASTKGASTQSYYVFNIGNNNGYVIAAGDDQVPAVLGYSDHGAVLIESMPANLKAWLENYDQQIQYIQKNSINSNTIIKGAHAAISPLMTTTWNQSDPFNQSCPDFFTYGKSVTGCVATAMAQIMYYHRNRSVSQILATIPAYTCATNWNSNSGTQQIQVSSVPAGSVIDWDNMLNSYSGSETATQKKAVADLMFYCGASVSMDYANSSNGGSGAYSEDVPDALKTYFGYSDNAQLVSRDNYSNDNWDNLIYNELTNHRPVFYSGRTSANGGHAFVCDGYDGNGYYHINWGWGGYCDTYFLLSDLTPEDQGIGGSEGGFNNNQRAIIGAEPSGNTPPPVQQYSVSVNTTDSHLHIYDRNGNDITEEVHNGTKFDAGSYFNFVLEIGDAYYISEIKVNGVSVGQWGEDNKQYGYVIESLSSDMTVEFTFEVPLKYRTVYCSANGPGSVKMYKNGVYVGTTTENGSGYRVVSVVIDHSAGDVIKLEFIPDEGCKFSELHKGFYEPDLEQEGSDITNAVNNNTYTFNVSDEYIRMFAASFESVESSIVLNETNFSDATFRAYISNLTGVAEGGTISEEKLLSVKSIDVSSYNAIGSITDLKGIEYFTALQSLNCYNNQLTSLDVSNNTALERLYCDRNQLTSLDLSDNTALTRLDCVDNQLTSLDVSNNTALTELSCYKNQLTSLDVSNNTALTRLDCGDNQLTSLDVSNNTALERLYCYKNQLTSLDVSNNTALTYLSCSNNQLTSLDVSNNTALTYLSSSNNQLTSLDVSHNGELTYLDCRWNQLTSLDVSNNTALKELYCNSNQLTSLDVSNNTALNKLQCDSNQLTSLDVSNNTALTELICSNNQLTSLDVSNNTALKWLSCFNNQLTSLDVSNNTALERLYCFNNQLTSLDLNMCSNLSSNNSISPQSTSQSVSSTGSNMYCTPIPSDFDISKVSTFTVDGVNTTPSLNNGILVFTASSAPQTITYQYDSGNSVAGLMDVTVNITSIEGENGVVLNETNFPDATFRAYISNITGVEEGETISDEKLQTVMTIDVEEKGITSLKGIEFFTKLTTLECSYNQLTTLNVSNNTELTELDCNDNQLTNLDVTNNMALQDLYCYNNKLTNLDVSKNTALTQLLCGNNQLTRLDVTNNTTLTTLWCYNNQLTSLDLSSNTTLTSLDCGDNQLTFLEVKNNMLLQDLHCYNNQLANLDVSSNTALIGLICNNNQLTSLDVSSNTALIGLICNNNQLTSLDISSNTAMKELSCYSNQLTSLDVSGCTALTQLWCYDNQLTSLDLSYNTALNSANISPQPVSLEASTNGSNSYSIKVSSDFDIAKVFAFKVNGVSATPSIKAGELVFTANDLNQQEEVIIAEIDWTKQVAYYDDVWYDNYNATLSFDNGLVINNSADGTGNYWEPQVPIIAHIPVLNEGRQYQVKFTLNAPVAGEIRLDLCCWDESGASYSYVINVEVGEHEYAVNFPDYPVDATNAMLFYQCGKIPGRHVIKKVQVLDLDASSSPSITYQYDSGNSVAGLMDVTVNITSIEGENGVVLNETNFPDATFRSYISHLTGVAEGETISDEKLLSVTSINVSGSYDAIGSITDLKGIEYFTALQYLNCNYNQLTSLDVSNNTALRTIYCFVNQLTNLDVSNNTALKDLDCGGNQLTSLDVSMNTSLRILRCGNNQLTSLDISNNSALTELGCSSNQLTSLDVSNNTALVSLICENNQLTSLDMSHNTALTYLVCDRNQLTTLDVSSNTALVHLTCHFNQLTSLDVSNNTALVSLICSSNQLTSLDISNNTTLVSLICSSNQLTSLDISNNTALIQLLCDNNQLTILDISNNTALVHLTCHFNQLMCFDASKCNELGTVYISPTMSVSGTTYVSPQLTSLTVSSTGSNMYCTSVPSDFDISKVSAFTVDGVSITPSLNNGTLVFTTPSVPRTIRYKYDSGNSVAGLMDVRVNITSVEEPNYDNTIYMDNVEVLSGTNAVLSVKMKNTVVAEGFEFNLYLPEGITVVTDEDGFPEVTLSTERTTPRKTNSFDAVLREDGSLRVLGASTNGSAISGNDGEIVQVKVAIADDMEEGEYAACVKDIAISDVNAVSYTSPMTTSTIKVNAYIVGDANKDRTVDVADFTAVAHHLLENTPANFHPKAADANQDERLDVADLTAIAHLILYGTISKPTNASGAKQFMPMAVRGSNESTEENYLYIDPVSVQGNSQVTLSIKMKNTVEAEGFGFDLYLPEGMTFATDADGFVEARLSTERTDPRRTNSFDAVIRPDGALRVLAASTNGSSISGNDGEIVLVTVNVDPNMVAGEYPLIMKEIAISDVDAVSHRTDLQESTVTILNNGITTDINGMDNLDDNAEWYTLDGKKLNGNPKAKGVYIMNGKKVKVK